MLPVIDRSAPGVPQPGAAFPGRGQVFALGAEAQGADQLGLPRQLLFENAHGAVVQGPVRDQGERYRAGLLQGLQETDVPQPVLDGSPLGKEELAEQP